MSYICKYCGKIISNKGCLVLHEKHCVFNPNHTLSKTQMIKKERDERRDENGILKYKSHKHTEKTKKYLSEQRKKWLKENPDKHVWKRNSKFKSEPCEKLKTLLKEKGISFVEEYTPFKDYNFSVDISWPDEKIGIEVNGNQHYLNNGELKPYYKKRHNIFKSRGWKIFEIHYSKCFNLNIEEFEDILKLPIYDKNYIGCFISKKQQKKLEEKIKKEQKIELKKYLFNKKRAILLDLIENSGIDFSNSGWSGKAKKYLETKNLLFDKMIYRSLKRYVPEFFENTNVWIKKRNT